MTRLLVLFAILFTNIEAFAAGSMDLLAAIRNGDHGRVQKLLREGADANTVDTEGTTALMHSVIESDVKMMKLFIDNHANVNARNSLDSTALMYAATNLAKTKLLLDAGADLNAKAKRGATPMNVAVTTFGSTPILKLLKSKGAEPEDRLMTLAAAKGDLEAIQYLLSIGVPPGDASSSSISAALTARCDACVRLLVEKGAPANGARPNGTISTNIGASSGSVLNDSVKRGMTDLSQLLVEHGASLASKDREGFTLLMQAVLSIEPPPARDRTVEWLLSKGADPTQRMTAAIRHTHLPCGWEFLQRSIC